MPGQGTVDRGPVEAVDPAPSLRQSSVSHLIEDGVDPLFVQQQAGHSWASTTAVCTTVGADAENRMLAAALSRAFGAGPAGGTAR